MYDKSEKKTKVNSSYLNPNKNPWFNSDCYNARLLFKKARNKYTKNKSDAELRNEFLHAKSNYNKIKRNQKLKFKTNEKDKLTKLSKHKPI